MRRLKFVVVLLLIVACAGTKKYILSDEAQNVIHHFNQIKNASQKELMAGTRFETPAFIFNSGKPGKVVMILGGTHGNEPAGYEAALRLVRKLETHPIKEGKAIVVPMANRLADNLYKRRIPVPEGVDRERGNLNRCYPGKKDGLPMEQMAREIEQLARKNHVQVFVDMHEAWYFHLDTPKESNRDRGLGQTIIYYPNESSSWLVINLLDQMNNDIDVPREQFSALEMPILHSAAWWAGKYLNIAAFTFETANKLPLQKRINDHLKLAKIILQMSGLW